MHIGAHCFGLTGQMNGTRLVQRLYQTRYIGIGLQAAPTCLDWVQGPFVAPTQSNVLGWDSGAHAVSQQAPCSEIRSLVSQGPHYTQPAPGTRIRALGLCAAPPGPKH